MSFLTVGSKQKSKNKLTEYHGIFILFKSRVYSKHGSPIFSLFGSWKMVSYLHVWEKAKLLQVTLNLTNLVNIQHLHENGKWIKCVFDGVYTLLKNDLAVPHCSIKMFYLTVELRYLIFFMVQQFLSHLPWIEARWFLFIWFGKSSLLFKLFTTYSKEKSTTRKIILI